MRDRADGTHSADSTNSFDSFDSFDSARAKETAVVGKSEWPLVQLPADYR